VSAEKSHLDSGAAEGKSCNRSAERLAKPTALKQFVWHGFALHELFHLLHHLHSAFTDSVRG